HVHGDPVEDDAEEAGDLRRLEIVAQPARALLADDVLEEAAVDLRVARRPLGAQLRVRAQHARQLEVDAEPVRAVEDHLLDHGAETLADPELARARVVLLGEREEDRPLVREVAEDRPAREADLLLEPHDRRPLVAVPGERAPRPLEDLAPPLLLVLVADLRHGSHFTKTYRRTIFAACHAPAR